MKLGPSGRLARAFIDSKLTPLMIGAALLLGLFAVLRTPREEEPQIVVPMVDVIVQMPGATAKEVEERVTSPMERLLWEIPGVEYIYSTSSPGQSLAIVRFKVGQPEEQSLVKLYNKLYSHFDLIPPGASEPLIKVHSIDDVPIMALTVWSDRYDSFALRRIAAQLQGEIKAIPDVSAVQLIGGQRRQLRVVLDPGRLAGFGISPLALAPVIGQANQQQLSGDFASGDRDYLVETGQFLKTAEDLRAVVVGVHNGAPVYLRDVADVVDGPEEPAEYVSLSPGPAGHEKPELQRASTGAAYPAVTLAISKRKGTNAIVVAGRVERKLHLLRGDLVPREVQVTVTRNYGETANEKSNELLLHMMIATVSVILLIAFTLGWKESGVVAIAVPVTLALTLLVFYLYGYTLNRITLFALIFSIGILVDDAIVVVENIVRHFRMPANRGRPARQVAVEAVDEVGNPTILATLTVIAAIVPMAFVGGLMGPYMRPIPIGASAAMIFSLGIAFIISPWAALRLLKREAAHTGPSQASVDNWSTRLYRRIMTPLIEDAHRRRMFLIAMVGLLVVSISLIPLKLTRVKMLPFDNKSEFQVIVDMPEGSTLEQTAAAAQALGGVLQQVPEVTDYETYAGTASPYNFNGLVRHYFQRQGANVADLQVNLVPKGDRKRQSHQIARAVRPLLTPIAERYGARVKVAEVPPGPPVLQTLVAEVYGPNYAQQQTVARQILDIFDHTPGVVDADWYGIDDQPKLRFVVDRGKAALSAVSAGQIAQAVSMAIGGSEVGLAHWPEEKEDVPIILRLPRAARSDPGQLEQIKLPGADGRLVPLGELVHVERTVGEQPIYHKNLMPVVYVTGDVAGREESPVYAILKLNKALDKLAMPDGTHLARYDSTLPFTSEQFAMKWDGEWHITIEVFRDLGLAFGAVMILIYILVVAWFQSFTVPLVIMAPIPLTLVGILPGHALAGAFFTATSMIGFIAGAGIIVRNSVILVDFIELRLRQGMPLAEAVIDAGAVRFRPMLLTAAAVIVGMFIMLFDPIFQGLALAMISGEVASTLLSRLAVPVLYYMLKSRSPLPAPGVPAAELEEVTA
jgi:multidrug efflux pump subunit AcrB